MALTKWEKNRLRDLVVKGYSIEFIERLGYKRQTIMRYKKALGYA